MWFAIWFNVFAALLNAMLLITGASALPVLTATLMIANLCLAGYLVTLVIER
jgi:hypothetical protein